MKKQYNRLLRAVITMLAIMLLGACDLRDGEDIPEGSVRIYRTDIGFSKLTWEYYVPKAQDNEALVHEILDRLKSTPESNVYNSIVPETVDIQRFYFAHEGELVLDFSESYPPACQSIGGGNCIRCSYHPRLCNCCWSRPADSTRPSAAG